MYQNDPEITELSFENMHMPDSRLEPRVAPKLMEALHFNTHLRKLCLAAPAPWCVPRTPDDVLALAEALKAPLGLALGLQTMLRLLSNWE